jgi:hypothetical protein
VQLGVKRLTGDAVEAVAVDVQALQIGPLQGSQNIGFGEMALAMNGCFALVGTRSVIVVALDFKARFAHRTSGYVSRSQAAPDEPSSVPLDH